MRNSKTLGFLTLGGLAATSLGLVATPANAETIFEATNCNDAGPGSLRQAIADRQGAGSGTVVLGKSADMGCDAIRFETNMYLGDSITITGYGAESPTLGMSGTYYSRIFDIMDFSDEDAGVINLNGLVFDGDADDGNENFQPVIHFFHAAELNLTDVRFTNFRTPGSGLITSDWGYDSDININSSTFDNLFLASFTGIAAGGEMTVTNSTFFSNFLFEGALVAAKGRVDFINNTVVDTDSWLTWSQDDSVHMSGNLIVDTDSQVNMNNDFVDHGGNIIAETGGVTTSNYGGVTNTTPGSGLSAIVPAEEVKLGTFANHGGLVPTYSIGQDSVAKNYFTSAQLTGGALAPAKDARGVARPNGAGFDSGAYEFENVSAATKKTATLTLYFNPMSKKLSTKAVGNIKKFVNRIPDSATNVSVTVRGYVSPASFTWNDAKLSLSRAFATKKALKAAGLNATRWNVKGEGKAATSGAKARKVVVTVTYTAANES